MWIPILGWALAVLIALVAFAIGVIEIFLVITDPDGRRLGDKMAETQVIETS